MDSGSLLGILIVCWLCWHENPFQSLKGISHIAVYGWSGISTLCVFSRTSLLTVQSLPSWEMSEEREVKDAHESV